LDIKVSDNTRSGRRSLFGAAALLLLLTSPLIARAQLNEADTLKFGYRLTLNGSWITGNLERLLVTATADLSTVHRVWAFRTSNSYQHGTFGKFRTENDLFSKNFFYLFPKKAVYPYVMGWLETNLRRSIGFRYQVGPGVSWAFVRKEHHSMKVSATATFEETRFDRDTFEMAAYEGTFRLQTARATARLIGQHRVAKGNLRIRYELWGQPSVLDADNFRLHADVSVEVPIHRLLAVRTAFNYNYESVVVSGAFRQDTFWMFGLTLANFK
jgi:hypothetical protein